MIVFCAPGMGKSELVKQRPNQFVDCDSLIEIATGISVTQLSRTAEWGAAKANVLSWWKQLRPEHVLLVGKDRYIAQADVVLLHPSAEQMRVRLASSLRENPITDWDCEAKLKEYERIANLNNKTIVRLNGYLSDSITTFLR